MWLLGNSIGRESHQFRKLSEQKKDAYEKADQESATKDADIKRNLMTSKVSLG